MTRETLLSLADRVEKLSGPCRETDALIRAALFAPEDATVAKSPINGAWCVYSGTDRNGRPRLFDRSRAVPHEVWRGEYTASIDAAMTLVPEGRDVFLSREQSLGVASIGDPSTPDTLGATPALALTGAALRARAEALP